MKIKILPLAVLLLLIGCNLKTEKTKAQNSDVRYETYHNLRFDFAVDYPADLLVPQGESDNQDGQKFLSEDGQKEMLVYTTFNFDANDSSVIPVDKAYQEDLQDKNVTKKELEDNYYLIEWKENGKKFQKYALQEYDTYFVIQFEYPEKEEKTMKPIMKHVIESFTVGVLEGTHGEQVDGFLVFAENFLNDCFWNKNFNSLLRDNDKVLATYIDSKMDVIRYFNPGAIPVIYKRSDNFGFEDYNNFTFEPDNGGELSILVIHEGQSICELDFNANGTSVYFEKADALPDEVEVINSETIEAKPVKLPYPDAPLMILYVPDEFGNVRGFYFAETPAGWKLVAINDAMCSA